MREQSLDDLTPRFIETLRLASVIHRSVILRARKRNDSPNSELELIYELSRMPAVRIRRFVNKRVAHITAKGQLRLPNFNELDAALDTIDRILCKYNLLLRAQGMTSAKATRQYDWTEVLTFPWIEKKTDEGV